MLKLPSTGALAFTALCGFGVTTKLARTLDSLVRVPRRVNKNYFVSIANTHVAGIPAQYAPSPTGELCSPRRLSTQGPGHSGRPRAAARCTLPQSRPRYGPEAITVAETTYLPPALLPRTQLMLTRPRLQELPATFNTSHRRLAHSDSSPQQPTEKQTETRLVSSGSLLTISSTI